VLWADRYAWTSLSEAPDPLEPEDPEELEELEEDAVVTAGAGALVVGAACSTLEEVVGGGGGGVNTEELVGEGCCSSVEEVGSSVDEVEVGAGGTNVLEEAITEDEDAIKEEAEADDDTDDTEDEEAIWVVDAAAVLLLKVGGELPTACATETDAAGAVAVEETDTPHASAIMESQLPSAVFCITVPHGPVPIMRPGYPHLPEHISTQFFCCQYFLAQAGPADP